MTPLHHPYANPYRLLEILTNPCELLGWKFTICRYPVIWLPCTILRQLSFQTFGFQRQPLKTLNLFYFCYSLLHLFDSSCWKACLQVRVCMCLYTLTLHASRCWTCSWTAQVVACMQRSDLAFKNLVRVCIYIYISIRICIYLYIYTLFCYFPEPHSPENHWSSSFILKVSRVFKGLGLLNIR